MTDDRRRALCRRFGLANGAMRGHGWKNRNWGLVTAAHDGTVIVDWFGYGDLSLSDLSRIKSTLGMDDVFVAGWKDQSPPIAFSDALNLSRSHGPTIDIFVTREGIKTNHPARDIF